MRNALSIGDEEIAVTRKKPESWSYWHIVRSEQFFCGSLGEGDSVFEAECESEEAARLRELIKVGAYLEAIERGLESLQRVPGERDVQVSLVEARSLLTWLPASDHLSSRGLADVRVNLLLARQALELRDGPMALKFTEMLVKSHPESLHARTLHLVAQTLSVRDEGTLLRAIELIEDSGDPHSAYFEAYFLWADGYRDDAVIRMAELANDDSDDANLLGRYLNSVLWGKGADGALDVFDRSTSKSKAAWVVQRVAAIARSFSESGDQNFEEFRAMLEKAPFDRVVHLKVLRTLWQRKSYLHALRVWATYARAEFQLEGSITRSLRGS